jgi:chromatin segregation and condensation protein Rec8/ScpA/Scc1 (kleisin family)
MSEDEIVIVSGLPRSGTSMMMRMLEAGGLQVVTDNVRRADDDNPQGYYEYERVKSLARDQSWLPHAKGRVVKVISALLRHLPREYRYRVVFMRREMSEILASQRQMLQRRGEPVHDDDAKMAALFERHLREVESWIGQQHNVKVMYVSYNDVLHSPAEQVATLNRFLDDQLNTAAMTDVVDRALHRQQRRPPLRAS